MPPRVAIVGAGRVAAFHLHGYREAGAEVVAVADVDEAAAERRAEPFGARVYADYREMLDRERPDAVSICTPPFLHAEQLIACARAGVSILAEKPFALTVDEGARMLEAARAAGVVLAVNFAHRFYEPTERVRALLDEGRLGRPITFHVRFGVDYTESTRGWLFRKDRAGGGAFMDTASHGIDLFRYLVGEVDRLFAVARHGREDAEVEDLGVFTLENAATGAVGLVEADWSTPGMDYGWSIHGTEGAAYVGYLEPSLRYRRRGDDRWTEVPVDPDARSKRFDGVVADFVRCLSGGGTPRATGADGLRALQLIAAGYSSAASGCAVDTPI